jgi:hypothetical protein
MKWLSPGSLVGPHWEVQLKHVVTGQWVTYTEHTTEASATALAERYNIACDNNNSRVIEVQ